MSVKPIFKKYMTKVFLKYIPILMTLIVIAIASSSCKKMKEERIVGTWMQLPLCETDPDSILWVFDEEGNVVRIYPDGLIDSATYYIEQNAFQAFVNIDNLDFIDADNVNGRYRIEKLNKKIMRLLREVDNYGNNGYKRREFEKQ